MWIPIVAVPVTFLLLLFPEGHLPSPRWRSFAWVLGICMVITFLGILLARGGSRRAPSQTEEPLGIEALCPVLAVGIVAIIMLPIGVVGSLVSLVQRFRRSTGIERLQLRLLVTAAGTVAILYASALRPLIHHSAWGDQATPGWLGIIQSLAIVSFGLIPIAIGVSVLRYHLFDIDLVINRALLLAAMVVFINARVRGDRRRRRGARREPIDPRPVRRGRRGRGSGVPAGPPPHAAVRQPPRVRKRATPYEVLSPFSDRLAETPNR